MKFKSKFYVSNSQRLASKWVSLKKVVEDARWSGCYCHLDGPTCFLLRLFCGNGGLRWGLDFAEVGERVGVANIEDGHLGCEG